MHSNFQGLYCSLRQLLEEGFFHADPHPGNLVACNDGSLAYFDFGMMGDIPRHYRVGLIQMVSFLCTQIYLNANLTFPLSSIFMFFRYFRKYYCKLYALMFFLVSYLFNFMHIGVRISYCPLLCLASTILVCSFVYLTSYSSVPYVCTILPFKFAWSEKSIYLLGDFSFSFLNWSSFNRLLIVSFVPPSLFYS